MRYAIGTTVLFFTLSCALVPVSGAIIPVYGTGLDNSRNFLPAGTTDPHYTLTLNALNPGGTSTVVPMGATVAEAGSNNVPPGWPFVPGVYATDNMAQWIGPTADIVGIPGNGMNSFYTYVTTFDLTGFDTSTVQLTGNWTADNFLTLVTLNGNPIYTNSSASCGDAFSFQNLMPFSISSGFQDGVNTLAFNVTNAACANLPPLTNPTGLLVDISGTGILSSGNITGVPEPVTMLPVAAALAFAFYRQRQKIRC